MTGKRTVKLGFFWNPCRLPGLLHGLRQLAIVLSAFTVLMTTGVKGMDNKSGIEEGQFAIRVAGKEIGAESFSIASSGDSTSSSSILDFHDPASRNRRVHLETQLNMDGRFLPLAYQLRFDLEAQKGSIVGKFTPGQVLFETRENGNTKRSGLLVGDRYSILDTNVFHHFIFIARLFNFDSKEKTQSFEVIVPQELNSGILRVSDAGMEKIPVQGKTRNLHHLRVDSGMLVIDLWVDDQHVLYKIALPDKQIEVIRN
jgi:hypothetical protein